MRPSFSKVNKPLVSVIMNCYNGDRFLKEAIESVYVQSYPNWEIIFWDNASSDQTPEIAKSYDDKLRYFRSKETTNLGKARVDATKEAIGEYISFLDSDDVWLKDKLAKQIDIFMNGGDDLGFVYGRSMVIFDDYKKEDFIYKADTLLPEGDIFAELVKENFIVFSSAMINREKFYKSGGFPEHFLNSTDYWVFLHMAKDYKCRAIHEVCCKNRIHEKNLSAKQNVVGGQEDIEVLNDLLPDERVVAGLKYQYVNLAVMYIKEMELLSLIILLVKHGGVWLLCKRVFKWLH
jgi:glycosyltransferase involved in cell wall biosynthesis